jgi:hypothetical protein
LGVSYYFPLSSIISKEELTKTMSDGNDGLMLEVSMDDVHDLGLRLLVHATSSFVKKNDLTFL